MHYGLQNHQEVLQYHHYTEAIAIDWAYLLFNYHCRFLELISIVRKHVLLSNQIVVPEQLVSTQANDMENHTLFVSTIPKYNEHIQHHHLSKLDHLHLYLFIFLDRNFHPSHKLFSRFNSIQIMISLCFIHQILHFFLQI